MTAGEVGGRHDVRLCPVVGGRAVWWSLEEDAAAEECEPGSAVYLSRDSLGAAVVVRGGSGRHAHVGDPLREYGVIARNRGEEFGELPDQRGKGGHFGAGGGEFRKSSASLSLAGCRGRSAGGRSGAAGW